MRRRKQSETVVALRDPRNAGGFMLFAICLMIGGGAVEFGPRLGLQLLIALFLIAFTLPRGEERQTLVRRAPSALYWLAGALLMLPILQLIPLPAGIWQSLPGRDFDLAVRQAIGAERGSFPLSIAPLETAVTPFAMLVLAGVAYSALAAPYSSIRAFLWLIIGFGALNVVVGVLQLASGGNSLDFYNSPHSTNLLGLFANRNHTALFLAAMMPIAWHIIYTSRLQPNARLACAGGALVIGWAGIIGTTSRAGIALGAISFILMLFLARKEWIRRRWKAAWLAFVGVGLTLVGVFFALSARTEYLFSRLSDIDQDLRWEIWQKSLGLVESSWPAGAGFGTFSPYYKRFETPDDLRAQFINNAHNDYLEVIIEGGLPATALLVAVIILLMWTTFSVLRREGPTIKSPFVVGLIFPWLTLAHSIFDYPMRRMAIAAPVVFFFVLALRRSREPGQS